MTTRKRIPDDIYAEILYRQDHRCCICRSHNDVQIHHINRNNSDNSIDNLTVVCLNCHSKITGKRGLGCSYSPGEVAKYKKNWEKWNREKRELSRPEARYNKELLSQIDLIICRMLAASSNSRAIVDGLNLLWEIFLWKGNDKVKKSIIDGLKHMSLMTIGDDNKAKHIPPFIWKMCEHFIMGPDYVPRTALDDGKNFIYECIKILIADARYSFNKWGRVEGAIDEIIRTSENFFLLGGLYKDDQIIKRVLKIYREAIDESVSEGTTQYRHGLKKIKSSLVRLENIRFKYNIESREIRETMATLNIMCSKSLA